MVILIQNRGRVRGEGERVRNLPVRRRKSSGINNYKGGRERERERESCDLVRQISKALT